jgi:PTS system galactitol-specific IIA component
LEKDETFHVFFKKNLIFHDVDWGNTTNFFNTISDILERGGYVEKSFLEAVLKREQDYPTGLQTISVGAAIPHADPIHIKEPFIAVVRPTKAIQFAPMGGSTDDEKIDAKIIFVLGVKRNGLQVKVLQKIMAMLSDKNVIDQLLHASTNDQLLEVINKSFLSEQII